MVDEKQEIVRKHTSSIHTASKLSLMQRKLMNALLYQAYDYLPVQKTHKVDIKTLCALIGYDSKDTRTLKNALIALAQTTIEWDILKPDEKKRWKVSTLLASAEIDGGVCEYEYSSVLAKELYNPERFALINMAVQRKFNSSYSLAIYENCLRFKGVKTTGFWSIDDFRRLLGIEGIKTYSTYGRLNDLIIKPSVREINKHSDITIKPYVDKKGRRVCSIRFSVQENLQGPLLGMSDDDDISNTKAYKELIDRGMSKVFSRQSVIENGEKFIFQQLLIADGYAEKNELKRSKQGLIRKAISEGYSKPSAMVKNEALKKASVKKGEQDQIERSLDALRLKKRGIEKNYRKLLIEMIESVFDVSTHEEQNEVLADFAKCNPLSIITGADFKKNRWESLLNWGVIKLYWIDTKGLPCPSFSEYALQHGIKDLDMNISKLEAKRISLS